LSVIGCDKGQFLDSTGSPTTEIRETGTITKVLVYDNVNLIFTNRLDSGTMMVSAGKNIIRNISTEYSNNTLTVKNKNKYNWTRDLNPDICVYLPCTNIEEIRHESVGTISCETALKGNAFGLTVAYGNGMIELELFYHEITVYNTSGGITDVVLKGECNSLYLYHANYAPCDCRALHAQKSKVAETGIQNCFISVSERLEPSITNYGNIYYYGNPEIVNHANTGKGKLIQMGNE
jgi:hypothetical protein